MPKHLLLIFALISIIGLTSCKAPSGPVSTEEVTPEAAELIAHLQDGRYEIDIESSDLYWQAFKPVGGHMGGISLSSGELVVKEGQPSKGSFVIDMDTITNADLDEKKRNGFLKHLASDDFFAVADHPTARFDITKVSALKAEGEYDYEIQGDLSLRGITESVTVMAKIDQSETVLTAKARAEVDRTKFGITVRSGSFFEDLGGRLIKDTFVLEMDLVAHQEQ